MILTLQGPDREILSIENIINFLSIKNILNRGIKDRASQTKSTLFLVVKKGGGELERFEDKSISYRLN